LDTYFSSREVIFSASGLGLQDIQHTQAFQGAEGTAKKCWRFIFPWDMWKIKGGFQALSPKDGGQLTVGTFLYYSP